jgi:nucleoside-diphosphate-sugar epimerase
VTPGILVTGATGYLGGLVTATLLSGTPSRLILPIRPHHTVDGLLRPIIAELEAEGSPPSDADLARIVPLELPPTAELQHLLPGLRDLGVSEIVHCAGCLSYFDVPRLRDVNIDLTRALLALGGALGVRRFVHLSSAFSCGYASGIAKEALHPEPPSDPTEYTRSKREAERLVASAGIPYLIVRPSVVIGHSQDGRYGGKRYGLYQFWSAVERFLHDRSPAVLHIVAPRSRNNFLHQDAFQAGFLAAYRELPDNAIMNLVSTEATCPSMRELVQRLLEAYVRPRRVYYYDSLSDFPEHDERIDRDQRRFAELVAVNLDIAGHTFRFETARLDALRRTGLELADATLETVEICQRGFFNGSPRWTSYLAHCAARGDSGPIETIEVRSGDLDSQPAKGQFA